MNANNTTGSGGMFTSSTMTPTIGSTSISTPVAVEPSSNSWWRNDILFVFLGLAILFIFSLWLEKTTALEDDDTIPQRGQTHYDYNSNNGNGNDSNSVANAIQKLSVQDWVCLYNKTFDSNDNQRFVLKAEHIVNTESKIKEQLRDNGSTKSSGHCNNIGYGFEDVESGEDIGMNRIIHDEDDLSNPYLVLETVARRNQSIRSRRGSSSDKTTNITTPISGSCVICFDELEIGDMIVSSSSREEGTSTNDNDYCQHIYHQECMIMCLATHSQRKFRKNHPKRKVISCAGDIESPCPTCRRNFCTISDEDLAVVIKTRFLETDSSSSTNE